MKKRFLLVALLVNAFYATNINAQDCNSNEMKQNLSLFAEEAKGKRYDAAYPIWKTVYEKCPTIHIAVFTRGEEILKHKIANSNGAEKQQFIEELRNFYDKYSQHHPSRFPVANKYVSMALFYFDEKIGTGEEVYGLLHKAFTEDKANFKNEKALYLYFSELVTLYEKNQKALQDVFDTYDDVTEKIQDEKSLLSETINKFVAEEEAGTISDKDKKVLEAARKRTDNYEVIAESIDGKLGKLADCENLIPLYNRNFDANKTNEIWLRRAAGKMVDKDCTSDPLFVKIVTSLHNISPSASSAYYLGILNEKNKKSAEAIKYFNESVSLETDNLKKSQILIKIASKHSKAGAVKYAQDALKYNPSNSNAYKIIAAAYADSANECGTTSFEKRAVYWLAAQVARKGGLESLASRYDALAPSKVDIFDSGMAGKSVTLKCWINQSVRVPSL